MKKTLDKISISLFLLMGLSSGVWAGSAEENLAACYRQAQNSVTKTTSCLNQELSLLKKEYSDTVSRVSTEATRAEKKQKLSKQKLVKAFLKTNKTFESYVSQECDFIKSMANSDSSSVKNESLACQINLYRMRIDMLENRYLSSVKQ